MKIAQGILAFTLALVPDLQDSVTAHAGLPVLIEALRAIVPKRWYRRLAKALGYKGWRAVRRHVESLLLLIASGGDHIDDVATLRADGGLKRLLGGKPLPSATQLKDFLYRFHQAQDGRPLTRADDASLSVKGTATIRPEGPALNLLDLLNHEIVRQVQRDHSVSCATLDVDATIIEAHKKTALKAYEGTVGYQPQMAWWAEQSVFVCDEFRDGNVPAAFAVKDFLVRAFAALPGSVLRRRLRGDTALYDEEALTWAADKAHIEFCVSADLTEELDAKIKALPPGAWKPYRTLRRDGSDDDMAAEERDWAEVPDFVPGWKRNNKKNGQPLRYIAVRVRSRQRDLLEDDGGRWRHFAVVSNMTWDGERLLRWNREKQGTVEHGHGVLKNELAGGTMPCGRFGSNAAWWRFNVLIHNLLQLLKARCLPAEMATMRPKALRFRLLNVAGVLVRHGGRLILRIAQALPGAALLVHIRQSLLDLKRLARAGPLPAV